MRSTLLTTKVYLFSIRLPGGRIHPCHGVARAGDSLTAKGAVSDGEPGKEPSILGVDDGAFMGAEFFVFQDPGALVPSAQGNDDQISVAHSENVSGPRSALRIEGRLATPDRHRREPMAGAWV